MDIHTKREAADATEPSAGSRALTGTESSPQAIARGLGEQFRDALLARDLKAMHARLEPDATAHSPIVTWGEFKFDGRDEAIQAIRVFMNEAYELAFTHICVSEDACTLAFSMRMGGERMEGMFAVEPGAGGLIKHIDVLIRGLLPVAVFGSRFGPGLSRHYSLWRFVLAWVITRLTVRYARLYNFVGVKVAVTPSIRALRSRAMTLPVR